MFQHDASPIVETIVKYGEQRERDEATAELSIRIRHIWVVSRCVRADGPPPGSFSEKRRRSSVLRMRAGKERSGFCSHEIQFPSQKT